MLIKLNVFQIMYLIIGVYNTKTEPEGLPIMLALCFMLWHAYYAQNYAGIIDAGLQLELYRDIYSYREYEES